MSEKQPQQHRYSKKIRIWTIAGSSAMALIGVLCITAFIVISSVLGKINFSGNEPVDPNADITLTPDDEEYTGVVVDPSEYDNAAAVSDIPLRGDGNGIHNILLVGVDSRQNNFVGLSDTNVIISINDNTKTIKMVSILRDTWVSIPGRDKDGDGQDDICKFNTAYAYGRHTLQHKTIAQNFRLDIEDYVGVNFQVLPILIDAMGGLDISLTTKEMTQIPADGCFVSINAVDNSGFVPLTGAAGVYHLNGFQAMEYARIRKIDSDFQRTARQRKVLTLLIEKAKTMSYTQLINVVYKAVSHVDTNMSTDEFLEFATNSLTYASYTVEGDYHIPEDGMYKATSISGKGSGILLTDPKTTVKNLHTYIYG